LAVLLRHFCMKVYLPRKSRSVINKLKGYCNRSIRIFSKNTNYPDLIRNLCNDLKKWKPRSGVEPDWNRSAGDCVAVPPPWQGKQRYIHIIDNKIIATGNIQS